MNWLIDKLQKEARRFEPGHSTRYYTRPSRGKGQGIVHQPSFSKGKVVRYDAETRRYVVVDDKSQEEIQVHPRNMVPDSMSPKPMVAPSIEQPTIEQPLVQPSIEPEVA